MAKQEDKDEAKAKAAKKADSAKKDAAKKESAKRDGGKADAAPSGPAPPPRLRVRFDTEILPALAQQFGRSNRLELPRLQKIVVNMGVGSAITEKKHIEEAVSALTQIAGQRPVVTKSRVAVAGFKLRENLDIGVKVTLRGNRMYEFLDRLISLALPRVRDFRGLSNKAFDGHGNYSLGLSEQLVFPELNPDKYTRTQGMNVTVVISGDSDQESLELLKQLGIPFKTDNA